MSRLFTAGSSDALAYAGNAGGYTKSTLAAWIYLSSQPTNGGATYCIMANAGAAGYTGHALYYYQAGGVKKLEWLTSLTFGTNTTKTITISLTTGVWYHICYTIDMTVSPNTVGFYVNGVAQAVTDSGDSVVNVAAGGTARIGCYSDASGPNNSFFDGRIAQVLSLNLPLTQAEVTALYYGASFHKMRPYTEYEGAWRLDGWATTEPDISFNQRSGTLTGTTSADNPPVGVVYALGNPAFGENISAPYVPPDPEVPPTFPPTYTARTRGRCSGC